MRRLYVVVVIIFLFSVGSAYGGSPTQFGSTGLLTTPTAETLDSGNLCLGVWGNYAKNSRGTSPADSFIIPATMTLGISPFWEIYGTYPNLLFNQDEEVSSRGTADIGMKFRFWGNRRSHFKLATDFFLQRHISEDPTIDGNNDKGVRLITSVKKERMGVHAFAGYIYPEAPPGFTYQDELIYGGGVEFAPRPRAKITAEISGKNNREKERGNQLEALLGFQYYLSPHLTLNVAGGRGLTQQSPEWRAIFGITTCQGVGTYIKPVPKLVQAGQKKEQKKEIRPMRIIPLSPLLLQSTAGPAPSHTLEVPGGEEEVIIRPYAVMPLAAPQITSQAPSGVPITPYADKINLAAKSPLAEEENTAAEESPLFGIHIENHDVSLSGAIPSKVPEKMMVYRKFRFPDTAFGYDQWSLSEEGKKYLAEVGERMRGDRKWTFVRIDGFSDNVGSENYNLDLSLKRAISVTSHLVSREGVEASRIFIKAMGGKKPLSDNSLSEGRRFNRRCEILLLQPK